MTARSTRLLVPLPGCAAALAAATGHGATALALVVIALALALADAWSDAWAHLPSAAVTLLMAALVVAEGAGWVDWRPLADSSLCRLLMVAIALAAAGCGWLRSGQWRSRQSRSVRWPGPLASVPVVVALPAVVMGAWGLGLAARPLGSRIEWFLGGDHLQHLVFTVDVHHQGNLGYATVSYPRAYHGLLALVWGAASKSSGPQGLWGLVSLEAAVSWVAYGLFALATGVLAVRLAQRLDLPRGAAAVAGLVASSLTLWPTFVSDYLGFGFETSVVAALLLAVALIEVIRAPGTPRAVLLSGSVVVLMAHVWQLLLPAACLPFAVAAVALLRRPGPQRGQRLLLGAVILAGAALAAPGVWAVVTEVGVEHAVDAGVVVRPPLLWLAIALVAAAALVIAWRCGWQLLVLSMVLVTGASALALAYRVGIGPLTYYPAKLLWQAAALGVPSLGVAAAILFRNLRSRAGRGAGLGLAALGAVTGLVVVACLATPAQPLLGRWSSADGPAVVAAVSTPGAVDADVVWLGGTEYTDLVTRMTLDFFRVDAGRPAISVRVPTRDQECTMLRGSQHPTVLSAAPPVVVRARYDCVPSLSVLGVDEVRQ